MVGRACWIWNPIFSGNPTTYHSTCNLGAASVVSYWIRAFTLCPYFMTDSDYFMVIWLRRPNPLASLPASRKVLRNKEVKLFQSFRLTSGTSWYHFRASLFSRPLNILCLVFKSSWFANAMDLNSKNQLSTSWLPSPRNLLYLRWIGILLPEDSSVWNLTRTSSKFGVGDLSLYSFGSGT